MDIGLGEGEGYHYASGVLGRWGVPLCKWGIGWVGVPLCKWGIG